MSTYWLGQMIDTRADRMTYAFPTTTAQRQALDDLYHGDSVVDTPTALTDGRIILTTETGPTEILRDGTMRPLER